MDFIRQWAGYTFPRLLMVLERVQARVADGFGEHGGSYGFFAAQVESLFRPRALVALEEYGLPIQIGDQIHEAVDLDVSLDEALEKVRAVDVQALNLSEFERDVLRDVRDYL